MAMGQASNNDKISIGENQPLRHVQYGLSCKVNRKEIENKIFI